MADVYDYGKKCTKTDGFLVFGRSILILPLIMTILNVIFVFESIHSSATEAKQNEKNG